MLCLANVVCAVNTIGWLVRKRFFPLPIQKKKYEFTSFSNSFHNLGRWLLHTSMKENLHTVGYRFETNNYHFTSSAEYSPLVITLYVLFAWHLLNTPWELDIGAIPCNILMVIIYHLLVFVWWLIPMVLFSWGRFQVFISFERKHDLLPWQSVSMLILIRMFVITKAH